MSQVRIAPRDRPRCPFCKDEVTGGHVWLCPACAAPHHTECLRTHGACSSCGAKDEAPAPPRVDAPPGHHIQAAERAGPVWQPDRAGDLPSPLRAAALATAVTLAALVSLGLVVLLLVLLRM